MIRISVVTMIAALMATAAAAQTTRATPPPAASPPTMTAPATTATPATPATPPAHSSATKATANKANQFADEASAKAHCSADTVVWVNTSSKVYHLSGTNDYGKTKRGAYMCQKDADQGGFHVAKGEAAKASAATTPAMAPKKP
jgi:hypothetical protein